MDILSRSQLDTEAGVISGLFVEHALEDVLSRSDDREHMAAVGVVAAALGLSGPSAGVAVISSEGALEPVVRVRFMLGQLTVSALLWNWPFREGQRVRVVGKRRPDGTFFAISVLDEEQRLIVSYPHVTAGTASHWLRVFWISLAISVIWWGGAAALATAFVWEVKSDSKFEVISGACVAGAFIFGVIGWRIGRRLSGFARMADSVFSALDWSNPAKINLRAGRSGRARDGDNSGIGNTYFRY